MIDELINYDSTIFPHNFSVETMAGGGTTTIHYQKHQLHNLHHQIQLKSFLIQFVRWLPRKLIFIKQKLKLAHRELYVREFTLPFRESIWKSLKNDGTYCHLVFK